MKDEAKSRQELLQEIQVLRGRLAKLEAEAGPVAEEEAENLAAIGQLAIELAAAPPEADLLPTLARTLRSISGAIVVVISLYDADAGELVLHAAVPEVKYFPRVAELLGRDLLGLRIPVSPELHQQMLTEVIRIEKSLQATLLGSIPHSLDDSIQKTMGIDHFAGLALCHGGELLGSAVLVMPHATSPQSVQALHLFAHLAAASLRRKQAEEALRESEERYRTLVETSPDAIALIDLSGKILMVNQQALNLYGSDAQELIGQPGFDFLLPDDQQRVEEALAHLIQGGMVKSDVYHLPRKDGSTYPVTLRAALIRDPSGQPRAVLGVIRDITPQRRLEKALQQRNLELELRVDELRRTQAQLVQSAKMAAVGELAAGVAHELNTPLNSVLVSSELLLERVALDGRDRERLEAIVRQARKSSDIICNLLDFARQRGSLRDWADVNQVLRDTLSLLRRRFENGNVALAEEYAPDLPVLLLDAGQMKEVFLSLSLNALQAMPDGGRLTIRTEQRGDRVAVTFADTGKGIAPDILPRIFEPFYTTRPVGEGMGLGLSVSLGTVQEHGGSIQVRSQVDEGSTFVVWLPIEKEELETPPPLAQPQPVAR